MSPGDHVVCTNDQWNYPCHDAPVAGKVYTVSAIVNKGQGFWVGLLGRQPDGVLFKLSYFKRLDPERIGQFTRMLTNG